MVSLSGQCAPAHMLWDTSTPHILTFTFLLWSGTSGPFAAFHVAHVRRSCNHYMGLKHLFETL
eukprot:5384378-Amphidinium_carterae.2